MIKYEYNSYGGVYKKPIAKTYYCSFCGGSSFLTPMVSLDTHGFIHICKECALGKLGDEDFSEKRKNSFWNQVLEKSNDE